MTKKKWVIVVTYIYQNGNNQHYASDAIYSDSKIKTVSQWNNIFETVFEKHPNIDRNSMTVIFVKELRNK